jgi:hypothetical protein
LVIGALGGSGTRVVAQILIDSGFHLGSDLNPALDNLWFTLLFKRPWWHAEVAAARPAEVAMGFDILTRAMAGPPQLSAAERGFVRRAALEIARRGHDHEHAGRGVWPLVRAWRLRRGAPPPPGSIGWGWKEPNSHVYLPELTAHFADLRFVYVARHGLDMAYSGNRAQLHNWGPLFGVDPAGRPADAMLALWVRAARRAREFGRALGQRFLWLDYDRLCADPRSALPGLLEFAGITANVQQLTRLAMLPQPQASVGRYKTQPWRELDAANVAAVAELGFAVED